MEKIQYGRQENTGEGEEDIKFIVILQVIKRR